MEDKSAVKESKYNVDSGFITRRDDDGVIEKIAKYDPDTGIVELGEEYSKYRIPVVRYLNDKGHKYTDMGTVGEKVDKTDVPAKPKMNPRLGDKTPAVVEWYARYARDKFLKKYGVRTVHRRTGTRTEKITKRDEDGKRYEETRRIPVYNDTGTKVFNLDDVLAGEQRIIADCKTHITHKHTAEEVNDLYDYSLDETSDHRPSRHE